MSKDPYHPDYDPAALPLAKAAGQGDLKKVKELVASGVPVNAIGHRLGGYYPLHAAAANGQTKIVEYLIKSGAKLEVRADAEFERKLKTPLILAAEKSHFDTVKALVEAGADVNAHSAHNNTPLGFSILNHNRQMFDYLFAHGARAEVPHFNLAVSSGDCALVQWFLDHGFKLDEDEHEMGRSHLSEAIAKNVWTGEGYSENLEMVQFLIEKGADVNRAKNDFAEPPLVQATCQRKWTIAKYLLEKGADPNLPSTHHAYALNYAARHSGLEVAELLLKKGAKVDSVDFDKMTPLDWAVENEDKAMFLLLVKHGANVPQKLVAAIKRRFGKSVLERARIVEGILPRENNLWVAAKEGDVKMLAQLIASGADANGVKPDEELREYKPLHVAAEHDQTAAVQRLLKAGAEVDGRVGEGAVTPLMMAVGADASNATIEALLEEGAEIDAIDNMGLTALDNAAIAGNERIVALLLAKGAKAHQWKNPERAWSTLAQAVHGKNVKVLEMLLTAGAYVGASGDRNPALNAAAIEGRADFVRQLLKAGADPNTKDEDGFPAVVLAVRGGSLRALKLLIEAGADINAVDSERETALDVAYAARQGDMIELLERSGGKAGKRKRPKKL